MIGSYLRETSTTLQYCNACHTQSATNVSFEPISDQASPKLVGIDGTRCEACGDVRLYQLLNDGTTDVAIREELDVLAMILTNAVVEDIKRERH